MNWCMLLIAASVACPWTRSTTRTYYWTEPTPVYVTCQPVPSCTYPSTMVYSPEVAQVVEEAKAVEADPEETALAAAAGDETEEDATEFMSFSDPAPYNGGDLALDWGVATIGAGTLYPNPPYLTGGAAGGFLGGRGGGDDPTFFPSPPDVNVINIINNNIINNCGDHPPGPQPVPEPATLAIWLLAGGGGAIWLRRRIRRPS